MTQSDAILNQSTHSLKTRDHKESISLANGYESNKEINNYDMTTAKTEKSQEPGRNACLRSKME